MISKLRIQFDEPQHGWMAMSIQSDYVVTLMVSSVVYDTLNEIIEGLHAVITGDRSRSVRIFEEPAVCELWFEREGAAIKLKVSRPSLRNREMLFETDGSFSEVCLPFWRALRILQTRFSAEEFELRWQRPFPSSGMERLSAEIRRQAC